MYKFINFTGYMKKQILTLSTLAIFAGAAFAQDPTKIWSIENQDSYTINAGEYIQAEGYYYNTTGEQHRGPVYNVGTLTINGTFETYVSASAQSLLDAKKVSGNGQLNINSALFIGGNNDFTSFAGKVDIQRGCLWFANAKSNASVNASEINLANNTQLNFTSGSYAIGSAIKGSGTIRAIKYPDNQIEDGVYIIKDATPANITLAGDISQFNGIYQAEDKSRIILKTALADSVDFRGATNGSLELVGSDSARKTIAVNSFSTTTTSGDVYMYSNKAVIKSNAANGEVGENSGTIYFGGNGAHTQENQVIYTFDKTTVLGENAGNVTIGGRGTGSVMAKGANITVTDNIKAGNIVFGGADGAVVEGNTLLAMDSGEVSAIYGGMNGVHNGSTTIKVSGGKVGRIHGGDHAGGNVNGNIYIEVKDAQVGEIYGSNYHYDPSYQTKFEGVNGNVQITVGGNAKVGQIRGGINTSAQESEDIAKEKMVLGGSVSIGVKGNSTVGDGDIAILGAGGSYGSVKEHTSINVSENATINGDIYAGANSVSGDNSGNLPYVGTSTWLTIADNATVNGSLYGGSRRYGVVKNNAYTTVAGGTINGNVYGGGKEGSSVDGMAVVSIGSTAGATAVVNGDVFGGGKNGGVVNKQTYVKVYDGATITGNLYGGGENADTNGTSQMEIYGGKILGDIYGGGKDGGVTKNSSIRFVSNVDFTGTVNGGGENGATVIGQKVLTFGGWGNGEKWEGDFNGKVENINAVVLTNNSNVNNLNMKLTERTNFGGTGILSVVADMQNVNIKDQCLVNVTGSAPLDVTFKNSKFVGNTLDMNSFGVFLHWGVGKMAFDGTLIENNNITRSDGDKVQGMLYYNGSGSGEVLNTVLKNNTITASQVQSSGIFVYQQDLNVSGSKLIGNKSIGSNSKLTNGAFYVENQSASEKLVTVSDTLFEGNSAENTADAAMARGGALSVVKRVKSGETKGAGVNVVLNDVVFSNNTAGKGGAIYVGGESLTINATKSVTFAGNTAANGGFLYMDNGEEGSTATANVSLNISNGANIAIGTANGASDSIEGVASAVLSKSGQGSLTVNGSMANYTGTLNVNEGTMSVNNGLGAKSVNIAAAATLGVALGNNALANSTVVNNGTLSLKRGSLADGATFTLNNYSGSGNLNAFGGMVEGNTFTAGKSATFESSAITIGTGASDVQSVNLAGKLALDFDVSNLGENALTLNNISESTNLSGIQGNVLAAFDVDLTDNGNDYSVVFAAYVGALEDASQLVAWHKGKDGNWTKLDTVIDYADEFASIVVDGFSSYAISQVPEPSTWAAIFGALALALAIYRRRK